MKRRSIGGGEIPGLKIEPSTPGTKTCPWGPRTRGTQNCFLLFQGRIQNGCETLAGLGELTLDVGLDGGDIGLTYGLMFLQEFGRRASVRIGRNRGS